MSNTKLRSATFSIDNAIKGMDIRSYTTRADTRVMLIRCIKDLHELGYKVGHVKGIKERHVCALVTHWTVQNKNPATIKNYMAKLRKLAQYHGEPSMIKPDNSDYQIKNRSYVPTVNKAITGLDLSFCEDSFIRLSLEGQALFGFRREESLKFTLSQALAADSLIIQPGWTKGGVGRVIKIRTQEQRQWIERVNQRVLPGQSLIPADKSYKQQVGHYKTQTAKLGLSRLHGLRHAYAQARYRELTKHFDEHKIGLLPPIAGGKPFKELSRTEQDWDRRARHILVRELGHSRVSIVRIYCG
jgi:ribosomal protein L24